MPYEIGSLADGRYEIQAFLGEGGSAKVYKACDTTTGQVVVLKMPLVSIAGDMAAFNRYRREIEIGERLDHPGIQRLLRDTRPERAHRPYMVLEYVEGESLRSYLRSHAPLSVHEVLRISAELVDVLSFIHAQGVVHRDLKPENILMSTDGHVKLTDFGIAFCVGARRLTFSHLSNAVGTPDYMAPEQVRGERGDARTDVYAFGVLLYELLTGRVPYPAEAALEAMRLRVETDPPLVRRARPDIPPALEAVVYRALRRKPDERYQSIAELGYDLAHLDAVVIPRYRPDIPPARPLGDLPPFRTAAPIFAVIFGVLLLLGLLAEFAHRNFPR